MSRNRHKIHRELHGKLLDCTGWALERQERQERPFSQGHSVHTLTVTSENILVLFQNDIFVELDEIDELDEIPQAWIEFNWSLTQAQKAF